MMDGVEIMAHGCSCLKKQEGICICYIVPFWEDVSVGFRVQVRSR